MKAMILAAGLGTRLRPYSLLRPKPLFPILDQPLLSTTISRLKQAGFSSIIVNAHHLREQIIAALKDEEHVEVLEEEEILGTGGGLRRALPLLGDEPVLVTNGDIYHTLNFNKLFQEHCSSGAEVSMVMHDYDRFNTVEVDDKSDIIGFDNKNPDGPNRFLAFTGIHIINPALLADIKPGPSCILNRYRTWINQGGSIHGIVASGHFWTDIGSPVDYLNLHAELLTGRLKPDREEGRPPTTAPFFRAANALIEADVILQDWVSIGSDVRIGAGARLTRVVVWDGTEIPAGSVISDTIVTPEHNQEKKQSKNKGAKTKGPGLHI